MNQQINFIKQKSVPNYRSQHIIKAKAKN